jgi:hypothetical protein
LQIFPAYALFKQGAYIRIPQIIISCFKPGHGAIDPPIFYIGFYLFIYWPFKTRALAVTWVSIGTVFGCHNILLACNIGHALYPEMLARKRWRAF